MIHSIFIEPINNDIICNCHAVLNVFQVTMSTLYWYTSLDNDAPFAPIGILRYLYHPYGVPNIINVLDSSSSLWLKNELVLSTTVKYWVPFNLYNTSSTSLELCLGLIIHLFKWVGSRHNLIFPLGFLHTHKAIKPLMISSAISTLCSIFSLTNLSNSFLRGSYIAWGTASHWFYMRNCSLFQFYANFTVHQANAFVWLGIFWFDLLSEWVQM